MKGSREEVTILHRATPAICITREYRECTRT